MATAERKYPVGAPRAKLVLIETQQALPFSGITVERYNTTRGGTIFEKHIAPNGAFQWFRIEKGAAQNG